MLNPVLWLLERRGILGKLAVITSIVPYLLARIPLLSIPMLIAGLTLLVTVNWGSIKSGIVTFLDADFWIKIQYFWFIIGLSFAFFLLYNLTISFIPPSFLIGALYLLIYLIWFNKINSYMIEHQDRIILKDYTKEEQRHLDFEPYLIPIILTLIVVFLISSLQSLILTRGRNIFTVETLYWSYPIVVLIIHYIVDLLFREQLHWHPTGGFVEWKDQPVPNTLPDIKNPWALNTYFANIRALKSPPDGILELLEENLDYLVHESQNMEYLPFQKNFIRCLGNWGHQARNYLHVMLAIILTSISGYRVLGLIPIYRRSLFYQMLTVIAMSGAMTTEWRELIEYEVINQRDKNHILDWTVGARYREEYYPHRWVISWDGVVYMGKEGYYEAAERMEEQIHLRPQFPPWGLDIWNLATQYARVFIGEEGRQILSIEAGLYDKLVYLSGHHTLKEYTQVETDRKMTLEAPKNRFVSVPKQKTQSKLSEEEKQKIVASYLDESPRAPQRPSILELFKLAIGNPFKMNLNLNFQFMLGLLLIVAFLVNIGLVYVIDAYFPGNIATLIISIQVLIMFMFSINPSNSDIKLTDEEGQTAATLKNSVFKQQAININSPSIQTVLIYLFYAIALLICYRILFA